MGLLARRSPRVTAPDPERPESALAIQAHVRRRVMAAEDSDRATYVQGCYVERLAERISAAGERRCVVYGAARVGTWLGRALRARGIQVAAFADGDPGRWNARVDGVPVLSPDAARNGSCHTYAIGSLASGEVIRREIGRRYEGASCRIYAGADQPGPEAISIHA